METSPSLARGLVAVPPAGPGVCRVCRDLIPIGYATCRHCRTTPAHADAVLPVSVCPAGGTLHGALRAYKDRTQHRAAERHIATLALVLEGFLAAHESCLAAAADAAAFDAIAVVPSSSPVRDELVPALRLLAGERCLATRDRYARLLTATGASAARRFEPRRYRASSEASGRSVLLLEDTWVTGARAQSAAAALRAAGALTVAIVAIGRYVNPAHADNGTRLAQLPPWSPGACSACAAGVAATAS